MEHFKIVIALVGFAGVILKIIVNYLIEQRDRPHEKLKMSMEEIRWLKELDVDYSLYQREFENNLSYKVFGINKKLQGFLIQQNKFFERFTNRDIRLLTMYITEEADTGKYNIRIHILQWAYSLIFIIVSAVLIPFLPILLYRILYILQRLGTWNGLQEMFELIFIFLPLIAYVMYTIVYIVYPISLTYRYRKYYHPKFKKKP